jgi:dolichyl-diphosphooligosaccharide--protein glycosyltransferase
MPAKYFSNETPMMTTLDSYYWLRLAKISSSTQAKSERDQLSNFPDGKRFKLPLIAHMIAKIAPIFSNDHYEGSIFLMIGLSGAFIFPLALYFYLIGFPISGLLGGLIGTFAFEYLIRTGVGRVDTDVLILFFLFLTSVFILQASKARRSFYILFYSGLAGYTAYLLTEWWSNNVFILAFAAILLSSLWVYPKSSNDKPRDQKNLKLIHRRPTPKFRLVVSSIALGFFLVCSSGFNFSDLLSGDFYTPAARYLKEYLAMEDSVEIEGVESGVLPNVVEFPNAIKTVTEATKFNILGSLNLLLKSPTLSAAGLISFLIFFVLHWRRLIPIILIFFVGALTFYSSRRFAIFLAPFVGIGYGFMVTVVVRWAFEFFHTIGPKTGTPESPRFGQNSKRSSYLSWHRLREYANYCVAALFFLSITSKTAIGFIPEPSVPAQNYASFLYLKDNLPKHSAIYTWWDYGYALTEITGRATFHDGGSQHTPKTFFIAQSFLSDSQEELYNTISYLTSQGVSGIYQMIENDIAYEDILFNVKSNHPELQNKNIYLLYSKDMIGKYQTINSIGHWDVKRKALGPKKNYRELNCNRYHDKQLVCNEGTIDLEKGVTHEGKPLREAIIVDDGYVQHRIFYPRNQGQYLQILSNQSEPMGVQLIDEEVYRSNFNQMFLLGQFDDNLFEQYYNAFPWTRVFRVRPKQ